MSKLICYGEMLMDCVPISVSTKPNCFQANPGGAPANVAIQSARLGTPTAFVGKVGADSFGMTLKKVLDDNNVCTENFVLDPAHNTSLAFVSLSENGDRSFSFYRNGGADTQLQLDELDLSQLDQASVFCYGSLMLTQEPARSTTLGLLEYAKSKGLWLAYDPNWRELLWEDQAQGIEMMRKALTYADLAKMSDEELLLITDCDDMEAAAKQILDGGVKLLLITMGPKGCRAFTATEDITLPTFDTLVVDTTGCGDSFFGTLLSQYISQELTLEQLDADTLNQLLTIANAAGSVCATKKGAIPALPTMDEIVECTEQVELLA